jgi:hypothetical protein
MYAIASSELKRFMLEKKVWNWRNFDAIPKVDITF